MRRKHVLFGRFHDSAFSFTTDSPALFAYAREHLAPLLVEHPLPDMNVTAALSWREEQPWPRQRWGEVLESWPRVDRDLYVLDNELWWFRVDDLRDLVLNVAFRTPGEVCLQGTFFFRVANTVWMDRLRRFRLGRRLENFRRRRFPTLVSYSVYYPLWWVAETRDGAHPLHAAAVDTPRGAVLFAGASGVGKSTLAVALAASTGNRLLADSFVLHTGAQLYAVPEPILLDRQACHWLGARAEVVRHFDHPYLLDRMGHHVASNKYAPRATARLLVFPQRGPEWMCARVSAERAWQLLSARNLMVNDLRRYFALAAVWEQVASHGLVHRREQQLRTLSELLLAYEVRIPLGMPSDEVVDRLLQLLEREGSRSTVAR